MMPTKQPEYAVKEDELCRISIPALMDIYAHTYRFFSLKGKHEENQCVYGFLRGTIEGTTRHIKSVETILHHPDSSYEFKESFFKDMDDFNARYIEEQSPDRIIGWYKSSLEPIRFKAMDVKNQLQFQELNKDNIALILDPKKFLENDGYGFSIFSLMADSAGKINIMSGAAKVPWEIMPLGDEKDSVVTYMKELINKTINNKKYVTELSEAFEEN